MVAVCTTQVFFAVVYNIFIACVSYCVIHVAVYQAVRRSFELLAGYVVIRMFNDCTGSDRVGSNISGCSLVTNQKFDSVPTPLRFCVCVHAAF